PFLQLTFWWFLSLLRVSPEASISFSPVWRSASATSFSSDWVWVKVLTTALASRSLTESNEEEGSEVEYRFSPAPAPIDFLPAERAFPSSAFLPVSANQLRRSYLGRRSAM